MCRECLCKLLLEQFAVFIRQLWLSPFCFDGGGFDPSASCLRVDEKWKWKIVAVTSPPGVCEFQNLKSGPYYGPPITQKCWFRAAGFSVNKWFLCVCVWLRCECQLLVPFSPHLQPLTLHCLHVVLFMSNKPFFCFLLLFFVFFFFFYFCHYSPSLQFLHVHSSQMFSTGLPLFFNVLIFFFFTLFGCSEMCSLVL